MDQADPFRIDRNAHDEQATYANFAWRAGEIVYTIRGEATGRRTRESIQIADDRHVVDLYAQFINHSFAPNLEVRGREFVAIRPIAPGDELNFNYLASESEIAAPFVCHHTGRPVESEARSAPAGAAHPSRG